MVVSYSLELGEHVSPLSRQVQGVRPPVVGVTAPLCESALLEVVDERDDRASVNPQRVAEGLLGLTLGGGEVAQHPEVPRMEVEAGEQLGEASMRVGAQLDQQEGGTPAQAVGRGSLLSGGIALHLAEGTAQVELFML